MNIEFEEKQEQLKADREKLRELKTETIEKLKEVEMFYVIDYGYNKASEIKQLIDKYEKLVLDKSCSNCFYLQETNVCEEIAANFDNTPRGILYISIPDVFYCSLYEKELV